MFSPGGCIYLIGRTLPYNGSVESLNSYNCCEYYNARTTFPEGSLPETFTSDHLNHNERRTKTELRVAKRHPEEPGKYHTSGRCLVSEDATKRKRKRFRQCHEQLVRHLDTAGACLPGLLGKSKDIA
jgi:hypothetical protein